MNETKGPERLQSYKDAKDKDTINWGELHFLALDRLARSKMARNDEDYIDAIESLETLFAGFEDGEYEKELRLAYITYEKEIKFIGKSKSTRNYYDKRARAINKLAVRVRTTKPRKLEYVGQDRITQEIGFKLIDGAGQNLFITGKTGSGKSYTGIALAKAVTGMTNTEFDVKKHIAFTPQDFIRIYNDEDLTPPGSAIMFDEVGVTLAARDAATRGNKIFSKLMQIIRHRRIFVIMTAPDLGFVDKSARKMLHWWLETTKIDRTLERCHLKPHVIEINQREGEIYYPYPVFSGQQVGELVVDKIDPITAKEYEGIAKHYKDEVASMTESGLLQEQANNKDYDPMRDKFVEMRRNGVSVKDCCEKLGFSNVKGTKYNKYYELLRKNEIVNSVDLSSTKTNVSNDT